MAISHAASLTKEEETDCLYRHLTNSSTQLRFIHADCEPYVENLLSETLKKDVDRAIERLSQSEIFDNKEAEMVEKLKNSSSECLREKLLELKYPEQLLLKVSQPNMTSDEISSEHLDFDRKVIITLLICSANSTFEKLFDNLVESFENSTAILSNDVNENYCIRKYLFNDTVLSFLGASNDIVTHGLEDSDCSEINKELDGVNYAEMFYNWVAKMISNTFETISKPCILRSIKKFPIRKQYHKLVALAGFKLNEEFKKSEKTNFVKILIDISEDILPCIWEN